MQIHSFTIRRRAFTFQGPGPCTVGFLYHFFLFLFLYTSFLLFLRVLYLHCLQVSCSLFPLLNLGKLCLGFIIYIYPRHLCLRRERCTPYVTSKTVLKCSQVLNVTFKIFISTHEHVFQASNRKHAKTTSTKQGVINGRLRDRRIV